MDEPTIRLIQITDTHLFSSVENTLLGIKTEESFLSVLTLVEKESNYDAIIMSGDLSQDGSIESYDRLLRHMSRFNCPVYYIPGNHDHKAHLQKTLDNIAYTHPLSFGIGNWEFVLLDSAVEGTAAGRLSEQSLENLEQHFSACKKPYQIIFLHHHPVDINCKWLETLGVKNCDAFLTLISKQPSVQAVVFGHIHQDFHETIQDIDFIATPSTCVQFSPGSQYFMVDTELPGYRIIDCHPDGKLSTEVKRIKNMDFQIDTEATRY